MIRLVLARVGTAVLSVVGASVLSFVLLRVTPGDPVGLVLGPFATAEARKALTEKMGLEYPVWVQYADYIVGLLHGDWGYSYSSGVAVREIMLSRLPASLEIGIGALVFTVVASVAIALGKVLARRRFVGRTLDLVTFVGLSLPQFWLALLLLLVFSQWFAILPGPEGRLANDLTPPPTVIGLYTVDALLAGELPVVEDALRHLVLPSVALGLYSMAFLSRVLFANLDVAARRPFVRASVLRGLPRPRAVRRHALPNAAVTTLTALGVLVGTLLTGGVLVEGVFAWPGIGAAVTDGIQKQDFSVVQAFILFSAVVYVATNLIVEALATLIDPRVRDQGATGRGNSRRRPRLDPAPPDPTPVHPTPEAP
ncbi:ABC transporter permease [Curtobacterium flaccumfaciens]|uniref:ABC transporter permease n=1 Tax=Curtobacterium flaccumfaciens TaxID=2035 RepID=UPI00188C7A25|nr:ABC transporter permease [Curtobacterium flaccumfaciens]MBF4595611.1 ABC transporter permease [Curtobacterium flaccumfaciens]